MLRNILVLLMALTLTVTADPKTDIASVLDDFHQAASQADGERYFGHFTEDAVFLGTDITERWDKKAFQAYAMPFFSKGKGWTYVAESRHIYLSPNGNTAWFDEILTNRNYGRTRGSGVLVHNGGVWKISQYHLTVPIPNQLLKQVVEMIERQ